MSFSSPTDAGEERRATLPEIFNDDICEDTAAIKDNLTLGDIEVLPGVVKARTVWIVLNEGVICTLVAVDETVTVGVGLYGGFDVI